MFEVDLGMGRPKPAFREQVRFRLSITKRTRRRSDGLEVWEIVCPVAEFPTFAASRHIDDLLPVVLVEDVDGVPLHRWPLEFSGAMVIDGEVLILLTYSLPASKTWPLVRCLMGLGYKQEVTR